MKRREDGDATDPEAIPMKLSFHGRGGSLFGIYVVNILLTLVTLGVYYFWGKAKVRRYLFSQTELDGDRFANHTTGGELFVGWIKVAVLLLLLTLAIELPGFFWESSTLGTGTRAAFFALFVLLLVPLAIIGSWRYRLSRSEWRGIRFSYRGSVRPFLGLYFVGLIKLLFSLGLYYPFFQTEIRWYLTHQSRFGTGEFDFDGHGSDLFPHFVLALLLTLPTLGLYWFWYSARKTRYHWSRTTFQGIPFRSTVTGGKLFLLRLGNFLLRLLTLGLASPSAAVRNSRFLCNYLVLSDTPDLGAVIQAHDTATATGEGLTDYLDFDFEF